MIQINSNETRELQGAFDALQNPQSPTSLVMFANVAGLPPAKDNTCKIACLESPFSLIMSNGVNWYDWNGNIVA